MRARNITVIDPQDIGLVERHGEHVRRRSMRLSAASPKQTLVVL
jgi:hypothetical protein